MDLDLRGHPLHTRALTVTVAARADGRLDVAGSLLDLRKRGFVPVGGDLQASGIVHHMLLDVIVDPATGRIDAARAQQPSVAFEASAATQGESCRDPVATVAGLVGGDVARGWPERVGDALGGPKACFHVFTLAHFLGATAAWALGRERALGQGGARPAGQRLFRRDLVVDGAQRPDGSLELALQLLDLHFTGTHGIVRAMDRFAESRDGRIFVRLGMPDFALGGARVAERQRTRTTLDAPWRSREDVAAHLAGLSLLRGATATLLRRFGTPGNDQPLLDASLMLAPTLIQVFAAVADWAAAAERERWMLGMGGRVDSCWMWRRDGALQQLRTPEET